MLTTPNGIMAFSYLNVSSPEVTLLMVLQTRKVASTTEQCIVLAQRALYHIRNLLVTCFGVAEFEGLNKA
jgi:hypothetical protein